jgi:hypothetical protein
MAWSGDSGLVRTSRLPPCNSTTYPRTESRASVVTGLPHGELIPMELDRPQTSRSPVHIVLLEKAAHSY